MKSILLHTVQNTGTHFIHELFKSHPNICLPNADVLGAKDGLGNPDPIWRDRSVLKFFENCNRNWEILEKNISHCCQTNTAVIWCHNVLQSPLAETFLYTNLPKPFGIVGGIRDPLLSFRSYLTRLSPLVTDLFPLPWCLGRSLPWIRQYHLWRRGLIELLPIDLLEKETSEVRISFVRSLFRKIGLSFTPEVKQVASNWSRIGRGADHGVEDTEQSPIKGKSQDLLKAYDNQDVKFIEENMGFWLDCVRVIAQECMPMFDYFGYDLWWYKSPSNGI